MMIVIFLQTLAPELEKVFIVFWLNWIPQKEKFSYIDRQTQTYTKNAQEKRQ